MSHAGEIFNWTWVEKLAQNNNLSDFPRFCEHISATRKAEGESYSAKVNLDQLLVLFKSGVIPAIFHPARFVLLGRKLTQRVESLAPSCSLRPHVRTVANTGIAG